MEGLDDTLQNLISTVNIPRLIGIFNDNYITNIENLTELNQEEFHDLLPNVGMRHNVRKFLESLSKSAESTNTSSINTSLNTNLQQDTSYTIVETPMIFGNISEIQAVNIVDQTLFPNGQSVDQVLNSCSMGNMIMSSYSMKKKLTAKERTKVVHILIDSAMECNKTISNEMFASMAKSIKFIFPSENSPTYYTPPLPNKRNSTGKLPDRYRNQRRYSAGYAIKPTSSNDNNRKRKFSELSEDSKSKIEWLKNNNEPWSEVIIYWEETREERLTLELKESWPALKLPLGHTLVGCL